MSSINRTKAKKVSYETTAYLGKDENGESVYKHVTAKTVYDVEVEIVRAKEELMHKVAVKAKPACMTVKEAIERYISERSNILSPSTIRGYKAQLRVRLLPLHNVRLDELTRETVQEAINAEYVKVGAKTVHNAWRLLHSVLEVFLPDAPPWRVQLRRAPKPNNFKPEDEDMAQALQVLGDTLVGKAALFASITSMSRSEICGLLWSAVDLKKRVLHVCRAMISNEESKWVIVERTKTANRQRDIDLSDLAIELLNSLSRDDERVFPVKNPSELTYAFTKVQKQLGLKGFGFHATRRYSATVASETGASPKYIKEQSGWSNDYMMYHYQGVSKDKRAEYTANKDDRLRTIIPPQKNVTEHTT